MLKSSASLFLFRICLTTDVNSKEPDQTAPIEVVPPCAHRLQTHAFYQRDLLNNLAYDKIRVYFIMTGVVRIENY